MADKMHHMLFVAVLQAPWKLRPCQPSKPGYDPTSEFRQSDSVDYYRLGLDFLVTMAMHLPTLTVKTIMSYSVLLLYFHYFFSNVAQLAYSKFFYITSLCQFLKCSDGFLR